MRLSDQPIKAIATEFDHLMAFNQEALDAFKILAETEGIIPALESAHAVAHVLKLAPKLSRDKIIVINLSGRGDKDCMEVARLTQQNDSDEAGKQ